MTTGLRRRWLAALAILLVAGTTGCQWRGLNSLPLPGTAGGGPGSFTIQAQLPNVISLQPNSRVRVGDVTVGNVTKVEMQGWHALLTMTLDGDVDLPANATVKLGQTSLFGSLHIELAPPVDEPPNGKLHDGSLIPLSAASTYPSTEQTLAAISMVLNGGGVGQIQDITEALSTAFDGRADDLRSLINQLDEYVGYLDDQKNDILAAAESLNNLVGQIAAQKPVVDKALETIPDALKVLSGRPSPTPCRNWVSSRRSPPTRSPKPRTLWCRSSEMSRPC
jgi:phospholipid/cholesterol/gamma-HCH transport system substrate-binding protein